MRSKKRKLKVTLVADFPLDEQRIDGGVQAVTVNLTHALKDIDTVDLHVITFKNGISKYEVLNKGRFSLHLLPRQRLGNLSLYYIEKRNLYRILEDLEPDIIHAQGAFSEGYLSLKSHYPSVITFHGMIAEDARFKSSIRQRNRMRFKSLICENYCVRNAENAILISPYVKKRFGGRLRARTFYINNPVKEEFFRLQGPGEDGRILYAGKIAPIKGLVDLMKAFGSLAGRMNYKLILAGSLDDETYVAKVKEHIRALDLGDSVIFTGLLDEKRILDEYERCTLLILPSYQENSPMVIQQAMAAGKPVIASRVGGVPNLLDDEINGLMFEPGDVVALSQLLNRLLGSLELRNRLGENAKKKALAHYKASEVALKTVDVYKDVMSRSSGDYSSAT